MNDNELEQGLILAEREPVVDRTDTSKSGLVRWLQEFSNGSKRLFGNRTADGLKDIDSSVAKLFSYSRMAARTKDSDFHELMVACKIWLGGTRPYVTSWRKKSVHDLYWKAAWANFSDRYAMAAAAMVVSDGGRSVLSLIDPRLNFQNRNPYSNRDYPTETHEMLFRADSRRPSKITEQRGFLSKGADQADSYNPFWDGDSDGSTISLTDNIDTAINVASALKAHKPAITRNEKDESVFTFAPVQNLEELAHAAVKDDVRGYVYQFNGMNVCSGIVTTNKNDANVQKEVSYLQILLFNITQYWAMTLTGRVGPYSMADGSELATTAYVERKRPPKHIFV